MNCLKCSRIACVKCEYTLCKFCCKTCDYHYKLLLKKYF